MFFLRERITPKLLFFTLLSVCGVLVILFANGLDINRSHALGLLFILLSVLAGAVNNILIRKHRRDFTTLEVTFFSTFLGFSVFNILYAASCLMDGKPNVSFIQPDSALYIVALLYLGTLSTLGSSFFTNYALSKIEAAKVGVFSNLVVVVTILAGAVFLGKHLSLIQLFGALMIFAGVMGANLFGAIRRKRLV